MAMKLQVILFDLDDTLLDNDANRFLENYLVLISDHFKDYIEPTLLVRELIYGTRATIGNQDSSLSNRDVFWQVFCERTGIYRAEFEPLVNQFYRDEFGSLRSGTKKRPEAKKLVEYCFERGYKVVIATNPLFPLEAIQQRLLWAGVPEEQYPYSLITAYENMHSTKPNEAYFREILDKINVKPGEALMVGDNWENDIQPAAQLGIHTYWITDQESVDRSKIMKLSGFGSLEKLYAGLSNGWLPGQHNE